MRTSSIELPSADEIRAIIGEESPRLAVHRDYLAIRPWLFAELSHVAAQASIDAAVFEKYQAWDFDKVVDALHVFVSECSAYLAQHVDNIKAEQLYESLKTGKDFARFSLITEILLRISLSNQKLNRNKEPSLSRPADKQLIK